MNDVQNYRDRQLVGGIRSADQLTVAVIAALAVAVIAACWIGRGGLRARIIDIETAAPVELTYRLDINSADWPEWTLLPGVGETLAQRIVRDRIERGPFQGHADLLRVNGIGSRTFARMRPYLLPLPEADHSSAPNGSVVPGK